jgi:hypothetical protein
MPDFQALAVKVIWKPFVVQAYKVGIVVVEASAVLVLEVDQRETTVIILTAFRTVVAV